MQMSDALAALSAEQRQFVREAWETEPELGYIFDMAARDQSYPGYDRWTDYERFKVGICHLVGWDARNDAVASSEHFHACLSLIDRLLPADVPLNAMFVGLETP